MKSLVSNRVPMRFTRRKKIFAAYTLADTRLSCNGIKKLCDVVIRHIAQLLHFIY